MTDFDGAIREALLLDESRAPDAPIAWDDLRITALKPSRPSRGWLIVAACLVAASGLAVVVARSSGSGRRVVPGAPTVTSESEQARQRAAAAEAELQKRKAAAARAAAAARLAELQKAARERRMFSDVAAAVAEAGWAVAPPSDPVSQNSTDDGRGVQYFEVRLRDGDVGELLVSIRTGDAAAVAAGTQSRGGLLQSDGTASVYLGTDSPGARAVELFDGTTIVYVRSEASNLNARSISDLSKLALAFNRIRR